MTEKFEYTGRGRKGWQVLTIPALGCGLCVALFLLFFAPKRVASTLQDIQTAQQSLRPPEQPAYFQFDYPPYPETLIFQLTDPVLIQEARDMLAGIIPTRHIMGTIVKEPVDYNPSWSYYLDPESVMFFDSALEICDATIAYVEANLDEACTSFLPGCVWCPWGSRLIAEVTTVPTPTVIPTDTATPSPVPPEWFIFLPVVNNLY